MAKYRFRGALAAAQFPLVSILAGRTVGEDRLDQDVRVSQTVLGQPAPGQMNTPQALYMENVIPTAEGMQSVGYFTKIAALTGATDFDQAITLRDESENNYLFAPARGKNYIWNASTGAWVSTNPITGWTGKLVTRAYVNGRTFICYEGIGVYELVAGVFTHQTLVGITDAEVRGIGSSSNYLIAFTELEVHWSSLVDPLDFDPSLTTGAGFSIPQDVKARITAVLGISGGFIVYTAKNAIAAVYTNNVRAPFTFKEIANAGGIQTYEQVTSEQTSGAQYAWTTGGLQKITVQNAEPVSAEINDFFAGRMYETFNPATKLLTQSYSESYEFPVKLSFISSRFLIISYSTDPDSGLFQWALYYDTITRRYGKLKIDHVDCFSYPYPNVSGNVTYAMLMNTTYDDLTQTSYADLATGVVSDPPSKLTIAFLLETGEVKLTLMDYNKDAAQQGVLILGKFQLVRTNLLQLQRAVFEGTYNPAADLPHTLSLSVGSSIDGYRPDVIQPMILLRGGNKTVEYARRITGINFYLILEGTFALSTYLIEATNDGDR